MDGRVMGLVTHWKERTCYWGVLTPPWGEYQEKKGDERTEKKKRGISMHLSTGMPHGRCITTENLG